MSADSFKNALDFVAGVLDARRQAGLGLRASSHKLGELLEKCSGTPSSGAGPQEPRERASAAETRKPVSERVAGLPPLETASAPASGRVPTGGPAVSEVPAPDVAPAGDATGSDNGAVQLPPLPPDSGRSPAESLRVVKAGALVCRSCPELVACRSQVVFDEGTVGAQVLFISEAPGADEDREGRPFAGEADEILQKMLQAMGLSRSDAYFTSLVKCRPAMPGEPEASRSPSAVELENCLPYLAVQIATVKPKLIVAFGAGVLHALFGGKEPMGKMRSRWRELYGIPLMPTFHPSYLIRNRALSERRKVWEDLLQVMERLGLPISERQRAFFLPQTR